MRVIAGTYRSRKLQAPPGTATRPTSDRLRETLFDVVAAAVKGSVWIDLYAGSGAVGIEALSRGARMVYLVESAKWPAEVIRGNLKSLQIEEGYELHERDALKALRLLDTQAIECDFIFLDPPYAMQQAYAEALEFIATSRLLKPSSLVIAEHEKHFEPKEKFGALERVRKLRQGDAVLSFYQRK